MRIFKKIIWILFFLLTLFVISAFVTLYFYGDTIEKYVLNELNQTTQIQIDVENAEVSFLNNFPNITLILEKVTIYNNEDFPLEKFPESWQKPLLKAEKLFLHANIISLIQKEVNIQHIGIEAADLFILKFKDSTNFELLRNEGRSNKGFDIEKISVTSTNIYYHDISSFILYRLKNTGLSLRQSGIHQKNWQGKFSASQVEGIKSSRTLYKDKDVSGRFKMSITEDIYTFQELVYQSSTGKLNMQEGFYSKDQFSGQIHFAETNIQKIAPFFNSDEMLKYQPNGIVKGSISIHHKKGKTGIKIQAGVNNASFIYQDDQYDLKNADIEFQTQDVSNKKNYLFRCKKIHLKNKILKANFDLIVSNFEEPSLKIKGSSEQMLSNFKFGDFIFESGTAQLNFDSHATLSGDNLTARDFVNKDLSLDVRFKDLNLRHEKEISITNANGFLNILDNQAHIDSLVFIEDHVQYQISGQVQNLEDFFIDQKELKFKIRLRSQEFDLRKQINKFSSLSSKDKIQVDGIIQFSTNYFVYDQFSAADVSGIITYDENTFNIISTSFHSCGGIIDLNANLRQLSNNQFIGAEIILSSVQIDELFRSFKDFNQDFISHKHIKGNANGSIMLTSFIDDSLQFNWDQLNAELSININNGEVINFEPMENLSRFADVNELKHVKFDKLENIIFIYDKTVHIPQMDINSNAFNMAISGTHNFDGQFSYHFQVLLSEILSRKRRKRDTGNEFGEIRDDGLGKTTLFLNIAGTPEDYKVKYDRKKVREKVNQDINQEKDQLKSIFKEDFKIFNKDTSLYKTIPHEDKKFIIEWEEDADSIN